MYSTINNNNINLCLLQKDSLLLQFSFLNSNSFLKSFYISNFIFRPFFFNKKNTLNIFKIPLISGPFIYNQVNILKNWIVSFYNINIIGFELWGLGLNVFLLNKRTKLGKKYKEKKKKKDITLLRKLTSSKKKYKKKRLIDESIFPNFLTISKTLKLNSNLFLKNKRNLFFNKNILRKKFSFKMGLSHRIGFFEPNSFKLLLHRKASDFRRKRFYFCTNNIFLLKELSLIIRYLKGINHYKFRGMKFLQEDVQLKIGKVGRV